MFVFINTILQFSFLQLLWIAIGAVLLIISIVSYIAWSRVRKFKREKKVLEHQIQKLEYENNKVINEFKEQEKIILLKNDEDKIRQWITDGITKFSDILRQTENNLEKLVNQVLSEVIKHLKIEIGGIWIRGADKEEKVIFELYASIAFDKKNFDKRVVYEKEELVGACAFDKQTQYITEITDGFITIASGLGKSKPKNLLLVPLLYNNEVEGIIEIASFYKIEEFKIKFLEEIGEKIAATIINVRSNQKTSQLLINLEKQALELQSSEEELRQNLEEVQATQEQATVREEKLLKQIKELKEEIKSLKKTK